MWKCFVHSLKFIVKWFSYWLIEWVSTANWNRIWFTHRNAVTPAPYFRRDSETGTSLFIFPFYDYDLIIRIFRLYSFQLSLTHIHASAVIFFSRIEIPIKPYPIVDQFYSSLQCQYNLKRLKPFFIDNLVFKQIKNTNTPRCLHSFNCFFCIKKYMEQSASYENFKWKNVNECSLPQFPQWPIYLEFWFAQHGILLFRTKLHRKIYV